ncbi:MAG TPA: SulP family inorganic anion transporter [Candidatus Obscuribacterales bacterium]
MPANIERANESAAPAETFRLDQPENGIRGLKHWRQDIVAGLIVALVSVPLSLGIALASGAPPICGLTSEIIAGLVFPFIGGAYVTISGPAAGLAPVLYSSIAALGRGDMELGYRLVLPIIMFAGLTQLLLTYLKAARFSYLIPRAAVSGMLASIGLLILAKQIPQFIGHKYHAHEFFAVLAETPEHILHLNPAVLCTSIVCLTLLFVLPKLKIRFLRYLPPHLVVVVVGIALARLFNFDSRYLVDVPANPLQYGIVMPDLRALFADPRIIPTIIVSVLALTFVDGTESLATIHAVDQIDPFRRKSNPDRTLFAMGVSNICSGLLGGLTIIPGIIKSSTCIFAGGRTAWVNFYNAMFLLTFLLLGHDVIRLIPIAALSAVLVHIAYKLAGPHQWQKMIELGKEQLLIFTTTVLVTVCSDLLIGIASGILMKVVILLYYSARATSWEGSFDHRLQLFISLFFSLFRSPLEKIERTGEATNVCFSGPLTCFNNLSVRAALGDGITRGGKVRVILTPQVSVVDHSSTVYLKQLMDESRRMGCSLTVEGLESLYHRSRNENSFHYRTQCSR